MMGYSRKQFLAKGLDETDWQKCFHRHQQAYIGLKLTCVKSYAEGKTPHQIAGELSLSSWSVRQYLTQYLRGGLLELCQPTRRPQPSLLTPSQVLAFKEVLLSSPPQDHGLEGRIWTGHLMKQYLKNTYQVEYRSGVYDLLERLNLSHQKGHPDYANADADQQQAFLQDFTQTLLGADPQTAVVVYAVPRRDEFSVCEKPTAFYGWAEKNTRPTFQTDEKKELAPTAYLPSNSLAENAFSKPKKKPSPSR
jgi:transposase